MKYAYYPGCSLSSTGIEYNMSTQAVAPHLDIELSELPDWNCCGASSAHLNDHKLALALPARNLAIGEEMGLSVAIPCAACLSRSKATEHAVKNSAETQSEIEAIIDRPYKAAYPVKSLLEVFLESSLDILKEKIVIPLTGLKAASYYGCLQARPTDIMDMDDPENPQTIDTIVAALGAEPIDWAHKTECCGNGLPTSYPEAGGALIARLLDNAEKSGAECIICACPMCFANLDMRQHALGAKRGRLYDLPVYYFTELIGIALGLPWQQLGINRHFVEASEFLREKGFHKTPAGSTAKGGPA